MPTIDFFYMKTWSILRIIKHFEKHWIYILIFSFIKQRKEENWMVNSYTIIFFYFLLFKSQNSSCRKLFLPFEKEKQFSILRIRWFGIEKPKRLTRYLINSQFFSFINKTEEAKIGKYQHFYILVQITKFALLKYCAFYDLHYWKPIETNSFKWKH